MRGRINGNERRKLSHFSLVLHSSKTVYLRRNYYLGDFKRISVMERRKNPTRKEPA